MLEARITPHTSKLSTSRSHTGHGCYENAEKSRSRVSSRGGFFYKGWQKTLYDELRRPIRSSSRRAWQPDFGYCRQRHKGLVTISLHVDFVGKAMQGDCLEFEPHFVKPGRSVDIAQGPRPRQRHPLRPLRGDVWGVRVRGYGVIRLIFHRADNLKYVL